ncbi:unnamed protein product [Miscanthus lutarioriparius]|uniref:Protein kinase domain-containing protein n=1 Tax=Miscanthus lutarioriparius TaxID=422564 RepID=A0A811R3G8_9POAL|nr:unnamed protein product [Miscanthus lutarioriparius]
MQRVKKMKDKFFKQNHGLLVQQLVSQNSDIGERMIITLEELEKATNNFDRSRVIGGGGHGIVFKGIIDLHVVAIKKSKIIVQREINESINEVVVLSQVNHRNVMKLLGCCLEAEVPLLVYEFISNGTLCHHLHVEASISIPWDHRIRIALEVARALSYLHSAISIPIFHRDIKSSNILLDDNLTAKVSDFGASRHIPIDKIGVTIAVQGTIGYLDPMYYYTGRLTDKSDVFSFGVLLIELLTRKKPYVYRSIDDDGLVSHFVSLLAEGNLVEIMDPQVIKEEDGDMHKVATVAAMCTKLNSEDRPTMREVEMILENLIVKKKYNGTKPRNHGLLLQQLVSHNGDIGERMTITLRDLEKATNNFDKARVIGGGGHGVVFKGIIDLKVMAIKKSRITVEREINEFINEVAILSQVNHRNVVKLLGCCLETKVPLLVYEFISNGTLYQHLYVEGPMSLPWVDRIRIALEVSRALSYLH